VRKRWVMILSSILIILAIVLGSCQSYIDEENAGVTQEGIYEAENVDVIAQDIEEMSDEDVVNYYVERYYETLEIQCIKEGFDISQKDIKSMLKEKTNEYSKSLREKWDKMPQSVKEYMRKLVFYDKKIRSNIGFGKRKRLYYEGKISEADLLNRYKEEAEKVGLFDYINKLMAQSNALLSSEYASKSAGTSIKNAKVGATLKDHHHDELKQ